MLAYLVFGKKLGAPLVVSLNPVKLPRLPSLISAVTPAIRPHLAQLKLTYVS
jgi:hypothetical protein